MNGTRAFNQNAKQAASTVLTSLRPSTYPRGYASALRSLRPCWTASLTILFIGFNREA